MVIILESQPADLGGAAEPHQEQGPQDHLRLQLGRLRDATVQVHIWNAGRSILAH